MRNELLPPQSYLLDSQLSNSQRSEKGTELIRDRINSFSYGTAITIPDYFFTPENETTRPIVYINELSYGIPTSSLSDIPELIVFEDRTLIDWLVESTPSIKEDALDPEVLWIFPGGGGRYMRELLEQRDIVPVNAIQTEAKRILGEKGQAIACNVSLPKDQQIKDRIANATKILFVDDTISTGITIDSVLQTLKLTYGINIENVTILVEALGLPRKKELLLPLLNKNWNITAAIFYAGETMRPRLLTTGSIKRGIEEPERFNAKGYPSELIEKVTGAYNDSN